MTADNIPERKIIWESDGVLARLVQLETEVGGLLHNMAPYQTIYSGSIEAEIQAIITEVQELLAAFLSELSELISEIEELLEGYINHSHELDDLTDVDASSPNDDDVLAYDEGTDTWKPVAPSGGVTAHSELTELDYASAGHTGFSPDDHSHDLDDLNDVDAPSPNEGDVLTWDDGDSEWQSKAPTGGGAEALDDLDDVAIDGTPADNEVLAYDTTSGDWINQTATEAGLSGSGHTHAAPSLALDDLTDVSVSSPDDGDVLTWDDGTDQWVAAEPTGGGGGGSLDDLTDVVISTPAEGEVVAYDSGTSKWENLKKAAPHTSANGLTPQIANMIFGAGDPPDPATVPEGTIYVRYI